MWGKKRRFGRKLTDFRPNVGVKSIDLGEKRQYTYHRRQRGHARLSEDVTSDATATLYRQKF